MSRSTVSPDRSSTAPELKSASTLDGIPAALRDELVRAFNEVLRNYRERRWEPSELNGGKLCEVTYTILKGHVDGKFPMRASKPPNMVDACRALEKADPSKFSRSVRVQIPRVLIALYEIRNNRGVGHVGGDVDPNLMDATAVVAMSQWILAELVRVFHKIPTEDAQRLVDTLIERALPMIWSVGELRRVLRPEMSAKDKCLLLLYHTADWVDEERLREWVEYSNSSQFRDILLKCHKQKLIEYDRDGRRVLLSPAGTCYVETTIDLSA